MLCVRDHTRNRARYESIIAPYVGMSQKLKTNISIQHTTRYILYVESFVFSVSIVASQLRM